jgi:hypothetical protein
MNQYDAHQTDSAEPGVTASDNTRDPHGANYAVLNLAKPLFFTSTNSNSEDSRYLLGGGAPFGMPDGEEMLNAGVGCDSFKDGTGLTTDNDGESAYRGNGVSTGFA